MLVAIRPGQMQFTPDVLRAEGRGARMRHVHDRRLGDRIENRSVPGADTRDRCSRDDRTRLLLAHQRHGVFHAEQPGTHVQVHDGVEALRRHAIGGIVGTASACIVEHAHRGGRRTSCGSGDGVLDFVLLLRVTSAADHSEPCVPCGLPLHPGAPLSSWMSAATTRAPSATNEVDRGASDARWRRP